MRSKVGEIKVVESLQGQMVGFGIDLKSARELPNILKGEGSILALKDSNAVST